MLRHDVAYKGLTCATDDAAGTAKTKLCLHHYIHCGAACTTCCSCQMTSGRSTFRVRDFGVPRRVPDRFWASKAVTCDCLLLMWLPSTGTCAFSCSPRCCTVNKELLDGQRHTNRYPGFVARQMSFNGSGSLPSDWISSSFASGRLGEIYWGDGGTLRGALASGHMLLETERDKESQREKREID